MGFRVPLTTAAAVDTGAGRSSVRMYATTSGPYRDGVVQWSDGINGSATGTYSTGGVSGGTSLSLKGGDSQGVTAPELDVNVESAPAGGYQAVARLRNAAVFDLGGADLTGSDTGWVAVIPPGGSGWSSPSAFYRAKNGLVVVRMYSSCSQAWPRVTVLGTIPAAVRPVGTDVGGIAIWAGTTREVAVEQGGVLRVVDAGTAGAGVSATIAYPTH